MEGVSFSLLVLSHIDIYIYSLVLSFIFLYPILKIYKAYLFHPYFLVLLFTVFANAAPIFLIFMNEISLNDFMYFVLSEVLFWIGFFFFFKKKPRIVVYKIKNEERILTLMFYFFLGSFIIITIYSYIKFGIPLFLWSRVALYVDSDGFGLIGRIQPMLKLFIIYYGFEKLFDNSINKRRKLFYFFVFSLMIIEGVLGGSKSSIMYFLIAYYFYLIINKKQFLSKKGYLIFAVLIISTGIVGPMLKGVSLVDGLLTYAYRFIASGDVYYYSLPSQNYKYINIEKPMQFIFSGFLAPARLLSHSSMELHPGNQLFYLIYPKLEGLMSGPNSRMPFLSLILFGGFGGILFSFLTGIFFAFITNISKILFYGNKLFFPLYIYIILMISVFIFDISLGMSNLFSIFINLLIYIIVMMISALLRTKYHQ
tara:strand:+ start:574 stop:1845 length:1272 start_codon:yes stop_codon:yes gene_type:complete